MPATRKILVSLAVLLGTVLVLLVLLPYIFRDRIAARLRAQVASSVDATVNWAGVDLGLLRDFPNVSLGLDRLAIVGQAPFAGDTLLAMRRARLVLDLGSVIGFVRHGDPIVVREIKLDAPDVRLAVLPDGRANWNITRPTPASGDTSRPIAITLRDLSITDGRIAVADSQSHLFATVLGLNERLRGDFAAERMTLSTRTKADSVSVQFAGISYLNRLTLEVNADVDADMKARKFTFSNDTLRLNGLQLAVSGGVQLRNKDVVMAVKWTTPSTAFRDILSLVPAIYTNDFASLQTSGTMSTSGSVSGIYGPGKFPSFAVNARVVNGAFKYPSLPMGARDISLDLAVTNPGGSPDRTTISLERFHAAIGGHPVDGRLVVRTPVSDPDIEARLVGTMDLADVARTVQLPGISGLAGLIRADVATHARMSDVTNKRYESVSAAGTFNASRVAFRTASPARAIAIDTAALHFTPRTTELVALSAKAGGSDARVTGSLDNLLGYLLHDEALRGTASVASTSVNLDEWKSGAKTTAPIPVPPRVDATLHVAATQVHYGALTLNNLKGDLHVKDQRVTLSDLRMETLRGTIVANGAYETANLAKPTFDVALTLAKVDIPSAFAALTTVRQLAPMAKWAEGAVAGTVAFSGPLAQDMTPVFTAITGKGDVTTDRLAVHNAPVFIKLADAIKLDQLRSPALGAVHLAFDVADGRVMVKPFTMKVAGVDITAAGSNGIDQSILYNLALGIPRSLLGSAGTAASNAIARLSSKPASDSGAGGAISLAGKLTGTVLNPALSLGIAQSLSSARAAATDAVKQEVAVRTEALRQRADSAITNARLRAKAEADKVIAEAERQSASIRAEARTMADSAKAQGGRRADSLAARATNPLARVAANAAAARAKQEAASQADRIVAEADARADALVAEAKRKAEALAPAKP